jgi:hypothetical protein
MGEITSRPGISSPKLFLSFLFTARKMFPDGNYLAVVRPKSMKLWFY